MYSVVLMAALSANGPDAVAFHKHRAYAACYGCTGCYGCAGCYGCGGCYGYGMPVRTHLSGYYWGGDYTYGIYGSYGQVAYGQYGCEGYHGYISSWNHPYGGTACFGGCYGSCLGSCYGCMGHRLGCYGGCYGTPIWYGPAQPYHPANNPMVIPPGKPADPPAAAPTKPMGTAKLILDVPADAKLYVDDLAIRGAGATREFHTPVLEPGQTYYYTVRVEATKDGQPATETRRVLVRAGEMTRESFAEKKDAVVRK